MLRLSDADLLRVHSWYRALSVALFALFALELVRYVLSNSLRQYVSADIEDYRRLLEEDEEAARLSEQETRGRVQHKYTQLRNQYRDKYAASDGGADTCGLLYSDS